MPTGACCIEQRLDGKSRMSGDVHVRFRERLGVRFPRATRLVIRVSDHDDKSRVDMRSKSRDGLLVDAGSNAKRIQAFLGSTSRRWTIRQFARNGG